MARDKTDKTDKSPAATHATSATQEVLGGDELHERVLTHLPATEENFIAFITQENDAWRELEHILEICDRTMLALGWDRKGRNNFPGDRTAEPFSKLWYAGRIGHECWLLLRGRTGTDNHDWALGKALRLGALIAEAEWRAEFKPFIVTGIGVLKGGKLGGEMRAGKYQPQTYAILAEMDRLVEAGQTIGRAASLVAKQGLGKNAEANRKMWWRHKGKGSRRT